MVTGFYVYHLAHLRLAHLLPWRLVPSGPRGVDLARIKCRFRQLFRSKLLAGSPAGLPTNLLHFHQLGAVGLLSTFAMLRIFTSRAAEFIGPQDPLRCEVWVVNLNVKRLEVTC